MNSPLHRLRDLNNRLAEKLSRVTSTGELIPEIDGLRFIAIGAVIFHHLMSIYLPKSGRGFSVNTSAEWMAAAEQSWLVLAAYCGHFGVPLFFVISGFILALPFARRLLNQQPLPKLKSYYLRRVTRLEPPYILCLIVFFAVLLLKGASFFVLLPNFLASLFYLHGPIYGEASRINNVTWSLEIEIQFYLLVPLLVQVFALRNAALRRCLLVIAIVAFGLLQQKVIDPGTNAHLRYTLPNFLHRFLTGFLLADFYLTTKVREWKKHFAWDFVTLAAGAAIPAVLLHYYQFLYTLPLLTGLLYAGFYLGKISNKVINLRWIVVIGGMCYTLYLYHVLMIGGVFDWTLKMLPRVNLLSVEFLLQSALVCLPLLVMCSLLFYFIEKPFMKWSLSARPAASNDSANQQIEVVEPAQA